MIIDNMNIAKLKTFLSHQEIMDLIDDNQWDTVYNQLKFEVSDPAMLTQTLITSDIDPLPYMTEIPAHMYSGTDIDIIRIPENIKNIKWSAFKDCTDLKSFTMDKNCEVTNLPWDCFNNCSKLEKVSLSDRIKEIGSKCFENCVKLESINLPHDLEEIWGGAFHNCSSLSSIVIPDTVELKPNQLRGHDSNIFYGCKSLKSITWRGKTYPSVNALYNELYAPVAQSKATKQWYRIKTSSRRLYCYKTKNDIRCNMVLDGFASADQCAVFFPSEKEALDFLHKNHNFINGWKVDDTCIYEARLSYQDKTEGFVRVKTRDGDVYIQALKAYKVGYSKSPVIPA